MSNTVPEVAATSAGILLYRTAGDELEVLLVHPGGPFWAKKDLGAWSVPKGEVGEGEDPRACALRELEEELGSGLGLAADDLTELGSVRQKGGKTVLCWAAEGHFDPSGLRSNTFTMEWPPRSGKEREFPEVDRAEWFGLEAAREKINPAQAELLERLAQRDLYSPGDD
ncbi:MAG TPA: NUDIX domain-containing protein [Solirubrobacterales bacterium]|nr:NUDIX domain-containing protein [Solirubrobacterales bacterium]